VFKLYNCGFNVWELHYLIRALNVARDSHSFPAAENWEFAARGSNCFVAGSATEVKQKFFD